MSDEPITQDLYMVVFEDGTVANVYFEEDLAIESAKYHYELEGDGDEDFGPVWVVEVESGHLGARYPLGMFPDRRGDKPGEWISAYREDGTQKKKFPRPERF
jgi:hypothetical protein